MENFRIIELTDIDKITSSWYMRYGFIVAAITAVILISLNSFVSRLDLPRSVKKKNEWMWRNTIVSWIHAMVIAIWTLTCLVLYDGIWTNPIDFVNPVTFTMIVCTTTYFLYDLLDSVANGKAATNWEITLHHVGVLATFVYNLTILKCLGYTTYSLLTEVNGVFLHWRRLLKVTGSDHNGLHYRTIAWFNLITCAVFRGAAVVLVLRGYYVHPVMEKLGFPYFIISLFSSATLSVIQVFLLIRLYRSDFSGKRSKVGEIDGKQS